MRTEFRVGNQATINLFPRQDAVFARREILEAEFAILTRAGLLEEQSLRGGFSRSRTQGHLDTHDSFAIVVMDCAGNIGGVRGELNVYDAAGTRGEIENPVTNILVPEVDGLDEDPIRQTIHLDAIALRAQIVHLEGSIRVSSCGVWSIFKAVCRYQLD